MDVQLVRKTHLLSLAEIVFLPKFSALHILQRDN